MFSVPSACDLDHRISIAWRNSLVDNMNFCFSLAVIARSSTCGAKFKKISVIKLVSSHASLCLHWIGKAPSLGSVRQIESVTTKTRFLWLYFVQIALYFLLLLKNSNRKLWNKWWWWFFSSCYNDQSLILDEFGTKEIIEGKLCWRSCSTVMFEVRQIEQKHGKWSCAFGQTVLDLSWSSFFS